MSGATIGSANPDAYYIGKKQPTTVGESLDSRIADARQHLEKLCIIKAKAETMQMLNHPISFIAEVCHA